MIWISEIFFFQAEDGIRDPEMSRGLGDVYKRQIEIQAIKLYLKTININFLS